ncbi:alpha-protein kinase vwkA-like [Stylophora pistillata]|nr:alpha-protein kinase vwkA-like [Stylophora pistillata]
MLKPGKVISKKSSTVISIYKFDFEHMQWSNVPVEAEFLVAEIPFTSGGFREAFKATSITDGLKEVTWVIKKYLKSALEIIKATQETEESHMKKSVQMHYLARNFASQLKEQIEKEHLMEFGPTFEYKKVFMGKTDSGEIVSIEEYIDSDFIKYINNNGQVCEKGTVCDKAQAFVHFTYEKSEGKLIVLDIQGAGYTLYDPEIASLDLLTEDGTYQFCPGNLSEIAIKKFFEKHQCKKYCKLLGLKLVPSEVKITWKDI